MGLFFTVKKIDDSLDNQFSNEQNVQNNNLKQNQQAFNQPMPDQQTMLNQPIVSQHSYDDIQNQSTYYSKPIKNIGSFIFSIFFSLIVFAIAIYIFLGPFLSDLVLSLFPSINGKHYFAVATNSFFNQITIFFMCQSFIYGILSLLACYFATKDAFRKKALNTNQIKNFKIVTSILYILFFGLAIFFNYASNVSSINAIKQLLSSDWLELISKSILNLFEISPIISVSIIGIIAILAVVINIKTINKKCY